MLKPPDDNRSIFQGQSYEHSSFDDTYGSRPKNTSKLGKEGSPGPISGNGYSQSSALAKSYKDLPKQDSTLKNYNWFDAVTNSNNKKSPATAEPPATPDPNHKDVTINDANGKPEMTMRWDAELKGYVIIAKQNDKGELQNLTGQAFRDANTGVNNKPFGGGKIPDNTNDYPQFAAKPKGATDDSVKFIYRYDPATKKDVVVGYSVKGADGKSTTSYFGSRGIMEAANKELEAKGLKPTDPKELKNLRPVKSPQSGKLPAAGNDQHPEFTEVGTAGDGIETYWRWDGELQRYTRVAQRDTRPGKDNSWWVFNNEEYKTQNSSPNAIEAPKDKIPPPIPSKDPNGVGDEPAWDEEITMNMLPGPGHGNYVEKKGAPVYRHDENGNKVMVGIAIVDPWDHSKIKTTYFRDFDAKWWNGEGNDHVKKLGYSRKPDPRGGYFKYSGSSKETFHIKVDEEIKGNALIGAIRESGHDEGHMPLPNLKINSHGQLVTTVKIHGVDFTEGEKLTQEQLNILKYYGIVKDTAEELSDFHPTNNGNLG